MRTWIPGRRPSTPRARTLAPALALAALALVALGLAWLSGCGGIDPLQPGPLSTGSADFTTYVNIGTSITAGYQSNGWVEDFQKLSAPQLIANQVGKGATFAQPLLASPGLPPVLQLVTLVPLVMQPRPGTPPTRPSVPRPASGYGNLAIPGETIGGALSTLSGGLRDVVLQGRGTVIRQCLAQKPTFVSVELGANEALGGVINADSLHLAPLSIFSALYTALMDSLVAGAPRAKLAVMNVPGVTSIPFATTVPISVDIPAGVQGSTIAVRLRDRFGPLADDALVTLRGSALVKQGYGLPGGAPPLPDSVVITHDERLAIERRIVGFNAVIAAQAAARGAALVDVNALLARIAANGVEIGGTTYSAQYISGGIFSLDGIHPSSLGSGILANEFILAIDAAFGADIPLVDLRLIADLAAGDGVPLAPLAGADPASCEPGWPGQMARAVR